MIHKASKRFLAVAVTAGMLTQGVAAYAQFGGGAASEPVPAAEKSIEEKLAEVTKFDFIDTELDEVAQEIGQRHGFSVHLDRRELEDAGIGTDLPVTGSFEGIRLSAVLELILRNADLDYVIRDDYLLITTFEAGGMLETRVYGVGDLLDHVGSGATMDGLINVLQSTVEPSTWDIVGGEGSVQGLGELLVVSHTQRAHGEIDDLLGKLRAAPAAGGATSQARHDDVPEGRSLWEMRVYSTHGLVTHELTTLLHTLLPELADFGMTRLITVGREEDQEDEAASDAALEELGLPRGGWLVVGQRPRIHDRLAELLGEGKLIEERDSPPRAASTGGLGGGGLGGGGFGGGGFGGGGGGGGGGGFF